MTNKFERNPPSPETNEYRNAMKDFKEKGKQILKIYVFLKENQKEKTEYFVR